jgi:hypothetical protein
MSNIVTKINLYAEQNSKVADLNPITGNVKVSDLLDGNGAFISKWEIEGLDKPTDAQLDALDAQATTLESNNMVRHERKKAYGDIGDQLDEIYKDIGLQSEIDRVNQIKTENPKS